MLWKDTPAGITRAAEHHLWDALGECADFVASKMNSDLAYRERLVRFALGGAVESSTDTRIARMTLGKSLFEPADWVRFFSAQFDESQLRQASQFPLHEDILMGPDPWEPKKLIKDTHAVFWGLEKIGEVPITVAQLIKMHPDEGKLRYFYPTSWHDGQPHIHVATLVPRWYVLRIEIIPGSTGMNPDEQMAMLPQEYEFPSTGAETAKNLFVFRKTGIRPNPSRWARCSETTVKTDTCSAGYLSIVGFFVEYGLRVSSWLGYRHDYVGAGASRKILEPSKI